MAVTIPGQDALSSCPGFFVSGSTSQQPKKLTPKQRRFVELYCGADDGVALLNASRAVLEAGYRTKNPNDMGYQLRNTPHVRARIDELLGNSGLDRGAALALLRDDAAKTVRDILNEAERAESPAAQAAMVSGMLNARTTARTNIARAHGLFTDNVAVSGGIEIEIVGIDAEQL